MSNNEKPFYIDFPEEEAIPIEVDYIVTRGLMPKPSLARGLMDMARQLGARVLFKDRAEIALITLLGLLIMVLFGYAAGDQPNSASAWSISVLIFTMSPMLYFTIAVMFFVQLRTKSTYETEMVCKYSVHQLAAFRMLIFSLISLAANLLSIMMIAVQIEGFDVARSILMSASSLFIFSALFMSFQLYVKSRWSWLVAGMSWISANVLLSLGLGPVFEQVLNQIPLLVYGFIAIMGFLLYVRHLKQLFQLQQAGGYR
ncbi:hypothetical protein ACFQ3J_04095 [Paenibacillus provencensis]|uniref:ABC-2 family transporter protein n=1 Tax=Paenibacillus provencensis TaxID=441151 RepID=A0ABW3Q0T4_9BACL|nr:hypothetical protein [Paenibacillus sp. MER 78]MCM3126836.1 hypothetical protein [Paenibacillus sp. MER 78]